MSAYEDALQAFFDEERIPALVGVDVPRLVDPETNGPNHADFFVPASDLHIEVKGQMTFDAMRKLAALSRATPRYYVYQHRDWDWRPELTDWPKGVLSEVDAAAIHERATDADVAHRVAHPPRATRAGRYQSAVVARARALQQGEILLMARKPKVAAAASVVTVLRLKRYLERFTMQLGW